MSTPELDAGGKRKEADMTAELDFNLKTTYESSVKPGTYDAVLTGMDLTYMEGNGLYKDVVKELPDGTRVNRWRWNFQLLDDAGEPVYEDGDPAEVDVLSGIVFNVPQPGRQASKQARLLLALMTPEEGKAWTSGGKAPSRDSIIGRKVELDVDINEKGYPYVQEFRRARPVRAAAKPAPTPEVEEE